MQHIDIIMKNLFKDREKFADLFNHCIFDGKSVINAQSLSEKNTENVYINTKDNNKFINRYHDLFMYSESNHCRFYLGLEGQGQIDYSMPIRIMLYDALSYDEQRRHLELRKNKTSGKLYRGKMSKTQKIIPIINIVLYYGESPWKVHNSLYEMMENPPQTDLSSKISNYSMNFINIYNIKNTEMFSTSLQYIFTVIKYKNNKHKLYQYILQNKEHFNNMDQSSKEAVLALLNHKDLIQLYDKTTQKGDFHMCNAINELIRDGQKQAVQIAQSQMILRMSQHGLELKDIIDISGLKEKEVKQILADFSNNN